MTECVCSGLCFATELDLAILRDNRHHVKCPLHLTEKRPRLFYYEEAENCWTPAAGLDVDSIVSLDSFFEHKEEIEIRFRRYDMTDEEFYNLPEA
jgi:hypothetical protein